MIDTDMGIIDYLKLILTELKAIRKAVEKEK
jgi:hypothetical protein